MIIPSIRLLTIICYRDFLARYKGSIYSQAANVLDNPPTLYSHKREKEIYSLYDVVFIPEGDLHVESAFPSSHESTIVCDEEEYFFRSLYF